ncbi:MAG: hypothetical protein NZ988_00145 [Thaumarchaeota archaeon]|nr:hypothetical protein [Candidatus Calditenuaceae archaeon]MDW8186452.1 hypothetical protein [Nitrososphaerota archaeon]
MVKERQTVQRIAEYFKDAGYSVAIEEDLIRISQGPLDGVVRVVHEDASTPELISVMIEASMDAARERVAYVAVPGRIVSRVGEYVFRVHGLGLVKYGESFVEEVVPPRLKVAQMTTRAEAPDSRSLALEEVRGAIREMLRKMDLLENTIIQKLTMTEGKASASIVEETTSLISRIERLENEIGSLKRLSEIEVVLESLKERLERLAAKVEILESGARRVTIAESRDDKARYDASEQGPLPSYLQDNPWVQILSKRGRE